MQIKQFIPQQYCKGCDACCRFLDEESPFAASISLNPYRDRFVCSNFDPAKNRCKDYENRPLDCRLYPFVVMWDEDYRDVVLGLDTKCPYLITQNAKRTLVPRTFSQRGTRVRGKTQNYKEYLLITLKDVDPKHILRFQDDIEILGKLDIKAEPVLNKLLIGDKKIFERYASQTEKPLSAYSFIANYVWMALLDYYWIIIDDNFCLFCKTKGTIFMPIPPIPPTRWNAVRKEVISKCFKLMNKLNKNKNCSRIEDVPKKDLEFFKDLGYAIKEKGCEYIYKQKDLANLAGDKYKDKRALCNYFEKNHKFEYREFQKGNKRGKEGDQKGCLELFKRWENQRLKVYKDIYYRALLSDSYLAHKKAMDRFEDLGLLGRVVLIDGKISAYTFGYPLNADTFVVLFEVTALEIKGLAQFIFREFCREVSDTSIGKVSDTYINVMDDSGLENLRRVKLSYRPFKIERTYCAYA